jgi:hypothetical protein
MKNAIFLGLATLALTAPLAGCGGGKGYGSSSGSTVSFLIAPPSGSTLPDAQVGVAYIQTFTVASGGTAPYTFGGVALPPGLVITTINGTTATLSGTPTQGGQGILQFQVADSAQHAEVEQYALTVTGGANTLSITPATLGPFVAGQPFLQQLTTTGTPPIAWSLTGSLPNGITMQSSQVTTNSLNGTFTRAGTFNFTINTQDATGATGTVAYTVIVN